MPFGRSLLPLWPLDPEAIYLNHGTVGVVPTRVAEAQRAWRDRIERHPSRFMLRDVWRFTGSAANGPTLMRQAAAAVAAFVGARADDLVFVDNTSTGVNAVLRSLTFAPGDEILVTDHIYGGILTAVHSIARRSGAVVRLVEMPYPSFDAAEAVRRVSGAITSRTRLAIVDHIAAESALVFPVKDLVSVCKARGVPVLVDGAHVPGQLALDVADIGADYYVANLHKWAMAPRSSAFMVVAPERQADLHPLVISWGLDTGFTQEFDWVGTRDVTPWLTAPEGIRFLQDLGFDALRDHNHDLAWHATRYLRDLWGTPLEIPESAIGSMVSVMTPESMGTTKPDAVRLRDRLLFEHNIEVHVHARAGRVWVRICAQAYNDHGDIEKLGAAVLQLRMGD
jgi:isopenicillin-N epimerase